ncbi:MAG: nicotinate (nicotinamide) nucleotide adenylyltransferase [Tepidisphaera sp.]|nr:nicotinate (nicotinamide) nucleotide adenylyltransferase [Tepidisphaera sp.]
MQQSPTTPLDVPADVADVVVMGGSFDPPHVGHTRLGEVARRHAGELAWLVFVPAARSPFKDAGPTASDTDRVAMLRLATAEAKRTLVWTDEIDRARPGQASYTIDTLRRARAWLDGHGSAGARLWLVIGADQAAAFHKWREAGAILELARPLVLAREGAMLDEAMVQHWDAAMMERWRRAVVPAPMLEVSSTALRRAMAGDDARLAEQWLEPGVLPYIRERGLYA